MKETTKQDYQTPEAGVFELYAEGLLCGSFGVGGAAGTLEDGDSYELN